MFGKKPQEPQNTEQYNFPNINQPSDVPVEVIQAQNDQDTVLQQEPESEKSELVVNAEKISRIASPYFIVIVGLALYDSNFLIGLILIVTGILYLLKVSTKDIATFWQWLKDTLGLGKDEKPYS